ncbi:MAG TPA: hypothetical protein VIS48_13325 [Candidatus Kryptonia bacterium]
MGAALIVFGRWRRPAAALSGLVFLAFVLFLHIPHDVIIHATRMGSWTAAFKEFAFFGGALVVAGSLPRQAIDGGVKPSVLSKLEDFFMPLSKYPLAIMVAVFGLDHFIYTDLVRSLVPRWIPGDLFWTYFAGIALIASGVGIIINVKARLAATLLGVMLFIWVIILHIPRAIADPSGTLGNEWTSVCEAFAFSGIAFIMGRTIPEKRG